MVKKKVNLTDKQREEKLASLRRDAARRQAGYREKALKIYPHLCASCGREFDGKRLKELTVHHKDHNHHNNPPDGSNWELLCLYCHDHEHEKLMDAKHRGPVGPEITMEKTGFANPFENLDHLTEEQKTEE